MIEIKGQVVPERVTEETDFFNRVYNPDVLLCLANLSNDEVFTPPEIANQMLDMLPQELFEDPNTTFLDPACKSGVFLREIAKRLIKGLEDKIPDLEERIDHICKNQLYGIAITELTSLLSRRSVYCSKYPNGPFSIAKFDNVEGNIRFKTCKHEWEGPVKWVVEKGKQRRVWRRCSYCGASEEQFGEENRSGLESHAYEFIHTNKPEEIYKMKFDVIISNPPYQMTFGIEGGNSANAKSIYNLFISQAQKLNPNYLCMITPSRWMTKTAQGIPDSWVDSELKSKKYRVIHDYEDAGECFPGVEIKGGVSYFLWDRNYNGECEYFFHKAGVEDPILRVGMLDPKEAGIVIRDPEAYSIIEKIEAVEGQYYNKNDDNFSGLVSAKHFFDDSKYLTSNWKDYQDKRSSTFSIKYYLNINKERTFKWISEKQLPKNKETKKLWKVYIPAAGGSGNDDIILGRPFIGEPESVCSQTFLVIGYDPQKHNLTEQQCKNIISYISTKFFRYLVSIKKKTQNGPRGVYQFVPMQDFNKPWSDEELFKKYALSNTEIERIENSIREADY